MASISSIYTQTNQYTTGTGGLTGSQYFQLTLNGVAPPAGSAFVIKYLSIASSTGFESSLVSAFEPAVVCSTSDDNTGTNNQVFVSYNPGTSTTGLQIFTAIDETVSPFATNGANQIISNQPYLGINVNFPTGGGTFYVTISYIVIPGGNALVGNFVSFKQQGDLGLNSLLVAGANYSVNIKSITFTNTINPTAPLTVQPLALNAAGNTITGYLGDAYTIDPYQSSCFFSPFYMQANANVSIGYNLSGVGVTDVQTYLSYCKGSP